MVEIVDILTQIQQIRWKILDDNTHLWNRLKSEESSMNAPDKSSLPAADRKVEGQRKGGRRSQGPNPSTQAAAQHSTGKSTIEKCTASRPVLPLRRNTSQIKSPSCVKPSSPIAIENILADLHKLRPVTADNQSSFLLNPAKSTPVAQSIRSVHRSGDKTGDETGDGGLKKVVSF